jgi:very-short-patch-repair endonuclease
MLHDRKRGTGELRKAIARAAESMAKTRSDLEDRFRTLVLDENLPPPEYNAMVELDEITIEADAVWREQRLIVELDSWSAHGTRSQFVIDRARDRAAQAEGWIVLRYTWWDINDDAADQLHTLLTERTEPRSGHPRSAAQPA